MLEQERLSATDATSASDLTVLEAIRSALICEMERDDRVVLLGEDVGRLGGVFRVTRGLQERFPDRVFDTPLAEAAIVGSALGLAIGGMVPVAEIQFLGFAHQAFHQLAPQLARYRYRSRGRYHAQVTVRAPFGGGTRTPEFHPDAIEAQLVQAPGLKVFAPAFPADAKGLLTAAIRDPDPVVFLEPMRVYRAPKEPVPEGEHVAEPGRAAVRRGGGDLTLVSWSAAVHDCLQVAEELAEEGIAIGVVDLRTLVPLDVDTLVEAVRATGRAVVVQEGPLSAGFAAEIAATLQQEAFLSLDAPIGRVGGPDVPYPPGGLEDHFLPTVDRIRDVVRWTLSF